MFGREKDKEPLFRIDANAPADDTEEVVDTVPENESLLEGHEAPKLPTIFDNENVKADGVLSELVTDMVNHPPHYKSKSGIEVIDVIESFTDELRGFKAVLTAQIIRYILRWPNKNGLEDLKKAQWYLNRLISKLELKENNE